MELCVESVRKPLGALYFVAYSIGYTALAGVAYACRDWRMMHAISAAPLCICPLLYWYVCPWVAWSFVFYTKSMSDITGRSCYIRYYNTPADCCCSFLCQKVAADKAVSPRQKPQGYSTDSLASLLF